jgi:hypothetical protein
MSSSVPFSGDAGERLGKLQGCSCQRLTPERGNNHPITEVSSFNAHIKNDVQPASSQERAWKDGKET